MTQGKTTKKSSAKKTSTPKMTVSRLKRMSKKDYMNPEQLEFFNNLLVELRVETVEQIEQVREELSDNVRASDMIDRAALEDERALKLRIVDRQLKLMKKIDSAIERIHDNTYGWCAQTGEPIGIERLLLRPTATLSIDAKEVAEVKERHVADER